jgi:hypothetical protein
VNAIHGEGEVTRALINANTMDALREKVNEKDRELQSAQFQLSQLSQNATIINALRPTPIPAYLTCSPFTSYGGNGCGCGCGGGYGNFAADLAVGNATATARNEAGLDFIGQGVNGIRNTLCEQNVNLCNQFSNVINAVNTNGYQTQLGQRDLQMQLSNCCCQTQQSIAAVNNNVSQQFGQLNYNIALGNCDIKNAIHAEGEATRALLQSQYTQGIERKLAEANQQLFVLENFGQYAGKKNCGCGIPATACGCAC